MVKHVKRLVLLTGATGYIGRRLKERLLRRNDVQLRLLVRNPAKLRTTIVERVEVVAGDTFDSQALQRALEGVEVAYYLIHSMGSGADYAEQDRQSAANFRQACVNAGVKRLIYLGGLGQVETASEHLRSRLETGEILSRGDDELQTLWFRAGVIIGAGSASFEIIHHLTQKLPLMITPYWVTTRTQPIAVDDVLSYLEGGLDVAVSGNLQIDIGTEPTNFKGLMMQAARSLGLKRYLLPLPFFSPKLSSYWLMLLTPVPFSIASALIEGLKSETVAQNDHAARYFPHIQPMSLEQAFATAVRELEQSQILSRWCDSSDGKSCDIQIQEEIQRAVLKDRRVFALGGVSRQSLFQQICRLGGEQGWGVYHPLWALRGLMDKLLGGVGLNRGRRQKTALRIGDAVDFWKVVDLQPNQRLLLLAQMKLPGKGWLEFMLEDERLIQTAYFSPHGLWGYLYWYSVVPFHTLVFQRMGQQLIAHAAQTDLTSR